MNIPGGGSLNAVNISLMKDNFIVDFSRKNFKKKVTVLNVLDTLHWAVVHPNQHNVMDPMDFS